MPPLTAAAELRAVSVWVPGGRRLLDSVEISVAQGAHLAVLGPNGAGKTTLLQLLSGRRHPSAGQVTLLGAAVGRVDLRELRTRIGLVDPAERIPTQLSLPGYVLTGVGGAVAPQPWLITGEHRVRAEQLLAQVRLSPQLNLRSASAGELARARLARALVAEPELLILDEPAAGLDLAGRELLLATLGRLAASRPALASVCVSHHVEDMAATTTDLLLLRAGRVSATGPISRVLTDARLSACFDLPLAVRREGNRWYAWARAG